MHLLETGQKEPSVNVVVRLQKALYYMGELLEGLSRSSEHTVRLSKKCRDIRIERH